ncbi:MAG: cytochrome c maturation protein CcmE, partial [Nitrospiria bacterium]
MKRFYLRWGGILFVGVIIGLFAMARYNREVSTIPPERLLAEQPLHTVRVLGLVEAGSLVKGAPGEPLHFMLSGGRAQVPVQYRGDDPENLPRLGRALVLLYGGW